MYTKQIDAILNQLAVGTTALQHVVGELRRFDEPYRDLQEAEMLLLEACQKINEFQENKKLADKE